MTTSHNRNISLPLDRACVRAVRTKIKTGKMNLQPKISCIITSYDRFDCLESCLNSAFNCGYGNLEIIIVNDGSTDSRYSSLHIDGHKIVNLPSNSKEIFGYGSCGLTKNIGASVASGDYLAFLDDDDSWLPGKLSLQIQAMLHFKCDMSCTDAYLGRMPWQRFVSQGDTTIKLEAYNNEHYQPYIRRRHKESGSNMMDRGFPELFTKRFIQTHNSIIASSVVISKNLFFSIGGMGYDRSTQDWQCWLKALEHTNCVYIDKPLVYYDDTHGGCRSW